MLQTLCNIKRIMLCLLFIFGWNESAHCSPPPLPKRIVSLAPAMTETLYSLGLGGRIVGVTNVCDRPAEARNKQKIGGMANPSLEAIVALRPDMVVMNREGNPKELFERLAGLGIKTYVFTATRLDELPAAFRKMGEALGVKDSAERLAGRIEAAIKAPMGQKPLHGFAGRKKALFVIWPEPLIVAGPGTIIDDAMSKNGLSNIAADVKAPYPVISLETVIGSCPPYPCAQVGAVAQQQRHRKQRHQFHRGRYVPVAPCKVSRPISVFRIKTDIAGQQNKRR